MKHRFSEKFEVELIRALNVAVPKPEAAYVEPPTQPQLDYLRKLNYTGKVESKREASRLISKLLGK